MQALSWDGGVEWETIKNVEKQEVSARPWALDSQGTFYTAIEELAVLENSYTCLRWYWGEVPSPHPLHYHHTLTASAQVVLDEACFLIQLKCFMDT